ncbi:MFS transporter [Helicobacter didelphidarum]|uniref:MFS transporter n=1 Tax=Helicobacter didelphidarum TaxID=2040648 RepID=A0A3D8INS1_9HELI|nr:MFS transporter [Helicobacter didelphidarum]RDU66566.1 MFS transporter [Helicobacter didelphidarum]
MQGYMKTIILLAFSSFCMGVAEFIISGIITNISKHYNILVGEAGNLATLYAIGVVIGAPIVSVLISAWNYKLQLAFTLFIFCFSNAIIFFADNFLIMLIARFIGGLMHGLFFVIATIVAIKVAPQNKTSTALSLMVSGLTIALVTGIPLGIFLSEQYSLLFPFAFIAVFSLLVAIATLFIMPDLKGNKGSFKNLIIAFRFPPLYQGFLITAFTCGSQFVLYVYLRVFLEKHGFHTDTIKNIFLLYGIAAIIGNLFGGKFADSRGSFLALSIILILQITFFSLMSVTYMFGELFVIINILCMAFFGFASIAPLKMLSTYLAHTYTPKTQNDTIALNEGAFNVGIAFASFIGGIVEHNISVNFNGLFSAIFSICAWLILFLCIRKIYYRM